MRSSQRQLLPRLMPALAASTTLLGPSILRVLVLLLFVLLLLFIGLMTITGGYEVGGPVLGSILLIGFGAANYTR
jgi:hypothetical protein